MLAHLTHSAETQPNSVLPSPALSSTHHQPQHNPSSSISSHFPPPPLQIPSGWASGTLSAFSPLPLLSPNAGGGGNHGSGSAASASNARFVATQVMHLERFARFVEQVQVSDVEKVRRQAIRSDI
jgi:hypothetical protein